MAVDLADVNKDLHEDLKWYYTFDLLIPKVYFD